MSKIIGRHIQVNRETNYVPNPMLETGTTGWGKFAEIPIATGTVGSGTAVCTISPATTILRGIGALKYTPGVAGNGMSIALNPLAIADQAKMLQIAFDFQLSGTITDGDYQVWIIAPSGAVIQPTSYKLSGTSGTTYRFQGNFQSEATGTAYRLAIYQSVTTAIVLTIDNVFVGPSSASTAVGTYAAKYQTASGGISAAANTAITIPLETKIYDIGGMVTTGTSARITAPMSGIYEVSANICTTNSAAWNTQDSLDLRLYKNGSYDHQFARFQYVAAQTAFINVAGSTQIYLNAGDYIEIKMYNGSANAHVIQPDGTVSWVAVSRQPTPVAAQDAADGRVVALMYRPSTDLTIGTSSGDVSFATKAFDTHGAYNGTTFTAPVNGFYEFIFSGRQDMGASTGEVQYSLTVTGLSAGSQIIYDSSTFTASKLTAVGGSVLIPMNAGDTAKLVGISTVAASTLKGGGYTSLSIKRLSAGTQLVAPTETVAAFYTLSATAASVTVGTSGGYVDFATKVHDTHGAATGVGNGYNSVSYANTWRYIVPVSGLYEVSAKVTTDTTTTPAQVLILGFQKNGVNLPGAASRGPAAATSSVRIVSQLNSVQMRLVAGDAVSVVVNSNTGSLLIPGVSGDDFISIKRIGN